jgi:hypothetical protein
MSLSLSSNYLRLVALVDSQASSYTVLGEKLTRRLRAMTYRAVLRQEMAFFDDRLATGFGTDC